MTHTPGPWVVEKLQAGAWNISGGPNAYYPVASRLTTVEHMEAESYANARLIAVAPQLKEALEHARTIVEKWCHYQGDTQALFEEYLSPIDAALHAAGDKDQ